MTKQAKLALGALAVLAVLYFINSRAQNQYEAKDTDLFSKNREHITRIYIQKNSEELELVKEDTLWNISGHDTLSMKKNILNNFFDDLEGIEREESPISTNPKNWGKYSVDDSSGTHLSLFGLNDKELGRYVLGRSKTNWSQNAIRIDDNPEVYLTSKNILHRLQTRPTYWGEKPKPLEEEEPELPDITIPSPPDTTGS
tara:strand:- start:28758 stop:29354 length:597 start_codon:yes stop_codon:yes gene_type:complete